jgi:4-alpha-glucanotransferase
MSLSTRVRLLHQLAQFYGLQLSYYDVSNIRRYASVEALLAVLRSLGAPVETLDDIASAWREKRQAECRRILEPVYVAWSGGPLQIELRLPSENGEDLLSGYLTLETGEKRKWEWRCADLGVVKTIDEEGNCYVVKSLSIPERLPFGYHCFTLEVLGKTAETLIIAAPLKAYMPDDSYIWGVFLPLYSLHTQKSWGAGDFSDLLALTDWVAEKGGHAIATLPLLAAFLDDIFEPSPYLPASRLMWNEFYLDIGEVPELNQCPAALNLLTSTQQEIKKLQSLPLVDYRRQMALKRRILKELCRYFFTSAAGRLDELGRFVEASPAVEDYARFRAVCERQRCSWQSWPQPMRDGVVKEGDYDEQIKRYHLYVQWLAHQQIETLSKTAREKGVHLYFDLPLGVHPDGYDVWRENNIFATGASAGAAPDTLFTRGQDWGFPPLHPEKIREQGYRYVISYLRHQFQHASVLRIDHVMGLHRLFWIASGLEASQGVYVRYRSEELYAILCLESHRNKVILVGEDLGTVPHEVRPAMARHGLNRMYVVNYELESELHKGLRPVLTNMVASLNTHDMSPFAAFWQGVDIERRFKLGFLDKAGARKEQQDRKAVKKALVTFLRKKGVLGKSIAADTESVFRACLAFLSVSQAWFVLVNLEDLWLETKPQNMPGTHDEYPNWQRKASCGFEEFTRLPEVLVALAEINNLRKVKSR